MSENYRQWSLTEKGRSFGTDVEILMYCAQYGALAPSTHNSQPWLCHISKDSLLVEPDFSKSLHAADPINRGLYFSLGCFVTNVRCAAATFNKELDVKIDTKKNAYFISIKLLDRKHSLAESKDLFSFVKKRFSNKDHYLVTKIPKKLVSLMQDQHNTTRVQIFDNKKLMEVFAEQYKISAKNLSGSQAFRNELSTWLRPNNTKKFDGMPGFVSNISLIPSLLGPFVIRNFGFAAKKQVDKDSQKLRMSPAVGIIYSKNNTPAEWIEAGELYERLALIAIKNGLSMTPMAAMVEDQSGANLLAKLNTKMLPQFFYRIGYSNSGVTYHTPRRPIVFR